MLIQSAWQQTFIEVLQNFLYPKENILALVVFGSTAQFEASPDVWSDVDALIITKDEALSKFFPNVEWLRPLGTIYAYEQHATDLTSTTRLCFTDMRRLDLLFMTPTALEQHSQAKFWQPGRIVFSKETAVTQQLLKPSHVSSFSLPSASEFEHLINQFWYRSTVAVYKVISHDWLIAWHLSLELIQDCCLLGMMLRDKHEQTNHHRSVGIGNDIVTQLPPIPAIVTANAILDMIAASAVLCDNLAGQWSQTYETKQQPLLNWIHALQQNEQTS